MKIEERGEPLAASTMPNSAACLIALTKSAPAFARPITLRLRGLRLQQEGREVGRVERVPHAAEHLAAGRLENFVGVALERVAEGVVGRDEEPGVAAVARPARAPVPFASA